MNKQKYLTLEARILIETLLNEHHSVNGKTRVPFLYVQLMS